jgi:hypothetical protein
VCRRRKEARTVKTVGDAAGVCGTVGSDVAAIVHGDGEFPGLGAGGEEYKDGGGDELHGELSVGGCRVVG